MSKLIEETNRKTAHVRLVEDQDFVEVTLWANGEGFDVSYGKRQNADFTWEEFEAIKRLVRHLDGGEYEDSAIEKIRTILDKYEEGEL